MNEPHSEATNKEINSCPDYGDKTGTSQPRTSTVVSLFIGRAKASRALWLGLILPLSIAIIYFFVLAITYGKTANWPDWLQKTAATVPLLLLIGSSVILWQCAFNQKYALGGYLVRALSIIAFFVAGLGTMMLVVPRKPPEKIAAIPAPTQTTPPDCLGKEDLKRHFGNYAKKALWEQLAANKDWATLHPTYEDEAVTINQQGENTIILGWHEGYPGCLQVRGNEIWVGGQADPSETPRTWVGPFVLIGMESEIESAFFKKIFGDECFKGKQKEQWCFGPDSIRINEKTLKATLIADQSELPKYGTALNVESFDKILIFVPEKKGWKIYQDTYVTDEGRTPINPKVTPPWRTLIAKTSQ